MEELTLPDQKSNPRTLDTPEIHLTTEHAASSHGRPVAVIDGTAYGPDDQVPSGGYGGGVAAKMLVGTAADAAGVREHPTVIKFCGV